MLTLLGRWLFGLSVALFGVQDLMYGRFLGGLPPAPPWVSSPGFVYATGVILIAAGISVAVNWRAEEWAAVIGYFFLACVVLFHSLHAKDVLLNGPDRTRALEPLALGAAALVLAGWHTRVSRYLFAFCLIVFGAQHFEYAGFLATLVPVWLPDHLFWIYFTGAAFIAAGLAIASQIWARAAAIWLGVLFLLWVLVLHGPRVAAHLNDYDEWSSAFVALAFCGASFLLSSKSTSVRLA